ncbi:MAG: trypsin-like serine protease [Pseudomonadota bacterium]
MLRHLGLAALVLALFSAVAPVSATTPLRTLSTADDGRGWEAVGRLDLNGRGFCTATLITPEIAMTAAHCLYDGRTGARLAVDRIEFQAGLRFGRAEAHRGVRRAVLHPDYDFAGRKGVARIGTDLALLQLDRPIRMGHVRPFGTRPRIAPGQPVEVVSYAVNRADAPSQEEACQVLTREANVLVLSCTVDFGASGAPVFVTAGGETSIVSVISAKAKWRGRPVALAVVMEGELDALMAEFNRGPNFAAVGKRVQVATR